MYADFGYIYSCFESVRPDEHALQIQGLSTMRIR